MAPCYNDDHPAISFSDIMGINSETDEYTLLDLQLSKKYIYILINNTKPEQTFLGL